MSALGFDIGGSNLKAVLKNKNKIIDKRIDPLPADFSALTDLMRSIFIDCSITFGRPKKIGIASASLFDASGKIIFAPNITYLEGKNLREEITQKTGVKNITLSHDSHAFLKAELAFNPDLKSKNVLLAVLGTGIGGAFTLNGKLVENNNGWSGEVGKMILDLKTGRNLEQLGGAKFIKSSLRISSVWEAKNRALSGDSKAISAFEKMGVNLAVGLSGAVNLLGSEVLVLGGGLMTTKKLWLSGFKRTFKANLIAPKKDKTELLLSGTGIFGGAIGSIIS